MLQNAPMYAYLPAQDVARSRRFYEGTLGFKPAEELAGGVTYRCGDHTACFLYPTPNAGTSKASQAFWQVEDVEREVAELQSRDVQFERYDEMQGKKSRDGFVIEAGGAKAGRFKDTEGNILAIVQGV
jgi:catechol 2,3-dioxygenase-like lactoylglutathione lyase family enzyme